MDATLKAHLDAVDAQIELARVQVAGLRHYLETVERAANAPSARLDLPERCSGVATSQCGLQDDENRIDMGSFTDPHRWRCRGCGFDSQTRDGHAAA